MSELIKNKEGYNNKWNLSKELYKEFISLGFFRKI